MNKKPSITIKLEYRRGYGIFDVSITVEKGRFLFWKTYGSGMHYFIINGYLTRLINNLKDQNKICYILFSRLIFRDMPREDTREINRVLSLATLNKIIWKEPYKERSMGGHPGIEVYYLVVNDSENIQKIAESIFYAYSTVYFLFETEANSDILYSKIKDYKSLNEDSIMFFSSDMIRWSMGCCSAEEELKIFSNRFDKEQIRVKILDSIDIDKVEVTRK